MPTRNNPLIKPYLKWAGGKRQLLPEIKKHLPPNIHSMTYYEPFVGAGAVLFNLQPKIAVINDINQQLIATYKTIKEDVDNLIALLNTHREANSENYYYQIRELDRDQEKFSALSDTERSARLIFLNKTCYNGLYRVNSQGLFNVPYGRYNNPAIYEESVLKAIHQYLNKNKITLLSGDFSNAVQAADRNSFVYFDPPYHSADQTNFTGYQTDRFGESEQIRLRDKFIELTDQGVRCLLSNTDSQFIRNNYTDDRFEIIPILAKRIINSDSSGRGNVNEVLIKNWKI